MMINASITASEADENGNLDENDCCPSIKKKKKKKKWLLMAPRPSPLSIKQTIIRTGRETQLCFILLK